MPFYWIWNKALKNPSALNRSFLAYNKEEEKEGREEEERRKEKPKKERKKKRGNREGREGEWGRERREGGGERKRKKTKLLFKSLLLSNGKPQIVSLNKVFLRVKTTTKMFLHINITDYKKKKRKAQGY